MDEPNLVLGKIDITPLLEAKKTLDFGIANAKSDLEKAGAIKAFEYTYELCWKTMKRILTNQNIETSIPKDIFRTAAQFNIIEDAEIWFGFIKKRNETTHTYNKKTAEDIFGFLPDFQKEAGKFITKIQTL